MEHAHKLIKVAHDIPDKNICKVNETLLLAPVKEGQTAFNNVCKSVGFKPDTSRGSLRLI